MKKEHFGYYQQLRGKFKIWFQSEDGKANKWAEYLLFAPDLFHLLCKLSVDPDVPLKEKAKLAAAIAYFISPLDLVPEAILGPAGYIDDISLAAYVLKSMVSTVDPEILRRHWAGERDVLEVMKHILNVADEMVGSGLWKKIMGMFK